MGELGIRRAAEAEQQEIRSRLEQARRDNAAAQQQRVADANRRLADVGLPPFGSRVTVDWGDGPAGEVTLHDITQDGTRAAVVWDHLPGTSLVPVAFLKTRVTRSKPVRDRCSTHRAASGRTRHFIRQGQTRMGCGSPGFRVGWC